MKSTLKIFGTLALAAVGASMAHAYASGYGDGYASAQYYESAPGLYLTAASGQYYSYGNSSVGSNWYGVDYFYGSSTGQYSGAYGVSFSAAQPGGSGFAASLATANYLTITNLSSHNDTLYVYAQTFGYGSSYVDGWNNYSEGVGVGQFYDSYGLINQWSEGAAATLGLGLGGDFAYAANYDGYNGYSSSSYYGGNVFPAGLAGEASDYQLYALTFAPGASDTFFTYAGEYHVAYSVTPGPAAVAPFAIGLIGALRRRKAA